MQASPLQYLRAALFNLVGGLWTLLFMVSLLPAAPFVTPHGMRLCARAWMRGLHLALRWTVGLRYEVRGLEHLPDRPVIIASKHQSAWETIFFHLVRVDTVVGLKHQLIHVPLFGWYLLIAKNIRIDRGGAAKALRSMIEGAKAAAAQGCSILIFPEGTRTAPGALPDYRPGVAALYRELQVPVVPVALNSGLFWGRQSFLKRPGTITVEFLPAIEPGLERKVFMKVLEERIETATNRLAAVPITPG